MTKEKFPEGVVLSQLGYYYCNLCGSSYMTKKRAMIHDCDKIKKIHSQRHKHLKSPIL